MATSETRPGLRRLSWESDGEPQTQVETWTFRIGRPRMEVEPSALPAERTECFEGSPYDAMEANGGYRVDFERSRERMRSAAWTPML